MIERSPVNSSNIKSVGYDKDGKTLVVEFNNGSLYHYSDVPSSAHAELMAAKSVGSHLNKNIRGVYKHEKQDAE
jgi:hypothetical protein